MLTLPDPRVHARYYFDHPPAFALAVDDPWWWAVLALGADLINVHEAFGYRGPLAIIGRPQKPWFRSSDAVAIAAILKAQNRPSLDAFACPKVDWKIVGLVNVVGCQDDASAKGAWFSGPYALEVDQPCLLPIRHSPSSPRHGQGVCALAIEKQQAIRYALTALANGAEPGVERH